MSRFKIGDRVTAYDYFKNEKEKPYNGETGQIKEVISVGITAGMSYKVHFPKLGTFYIYDYEMEFVTSE